MPAPTLSLTTELEAVNAVLATISEAPINTLVGPLSADAATARQMLHNASRMLQLQGHSFNTDEEETLYPEESGVVTIPRDALLVLFPTNADLIVRANKVYNKSTKSYEIGDTVSVTIIRFLPFEELPEHARTLIYMRAGKKFQDQILGDGTLHQITDADVSEAETVFEGIEEVLAPSNSNTKVSTIRRLSNRRVIR